MLYFPAIVPKSILVQFVVHALFVQTPTLTAVTVPPDGTKWEADSAPSLIIVRNNPATAIAFIAPNDTCLAEQLHPYLFEELPISALASVKQLSSDSNKP